MKRTVKLYPNQRGLAIRLGVICSREPQIFGGTGLRGGKNSLQKGLPDRDRNLAIFFPF